MTTELPPDVVGHMAGLGGTDEPLEMCNSCQRAMVYGSMLQVGAIGAALGEALDNPRKWRTHVRFAIEAARAAANALLAVSKVDFEGSVDIDGMTEADYRIALESFTHARLDHYTDEDGQIVLESHDEHGQSINPLEPREWREENEDDDY